MDASSLQSLDPAYVKERLAKPPFVTVDGVLNCRDLGSYPSSKYPSKITRPGFVFRSAELHGMTEEGKSQFQALRIHKVFDLRSDTEIAKYQHSQPNPTIEGVEFLHTPIFQKEDYSPEVMAKRFQLYASGKTEAFMELYTQILDHAGPTFGLIFRHIRDNPTQGCVFHCTAGKDRTGVLAALILELAGIDDEIIAEDYSLTKVGREPAREMIMARLTKEPLFATNNEAAMNMFSSRPDTMLAFLSLLRTKYGGVESYLKEYCKLTDGDIETIRSNILSSKDEPVSTR